MLLQEEWAQLLERTHTGECRARLPCKCSPITRIRLFTFLRDEYMGRPEILKLIDAESETLRKAAVMYTHTPHMCSTL